MARLSAADQAWLDRQNPRAAARADLPVNDILEVPLEAAQWQRALARQVLARFWQLASWHPHITSTVLAEEADPVVYTAAGRSRPSYNPNRLSLYLWGPNIVGQGYWPHYQDNTVNGSLPTDPTYSSATLTPYELAAKITRSRENRADLRALSWDGADTYVKTSDSRVDPFDANELAEQLVRSAEDAIFGGAGTNTAPVTGFLHQSGTTTQAATGSPSDEIATALQTLRIARRWPNVCFVSNAVYGVMRREKDSNGRYLFPIGQPITIDGIPVVATTGLDTSTASTAIVTDGRYAVVTYRVQGTGDLVLLNRSEHTRFSTDEQVTMARLRFDFGLVPGAGGGSTILVTGLPTA